MSVPPIWLFSGGIKPDCHLDRPMRKAPAMVEGEIYSNILGRGAGNHLIGTFSLLLHIVMQVVQPSDSFEQWNHSPPLSSSSSLHD
ncbi:hypothetical protein Scep_005995 [Stephania cephalantha]|uniref:Uncharacterized protein n=1 Tax=Stephania cephalantha TaxID=152367 RepID=A0AAP0K771_9MAGN